jgi:hypothetical protein
MNLNINFIRSAETGFTFWNVGTEYVLNFMIKSTSEFKTSESIQSFINYIKTQKYAKIRVSWVGITPDIELSDFIETPIVQSPEQPYPTVFNPFNASNVQKQTQPKSYKIDLDTLIKHIRTYPAHPNFLDSSDKNYPKMANYIKATLGKNMTKEYIDTLCADLMDYAQKNPDQ